MSDIKVEWITGGLIASHLVVVEDDGMDVPLGSMDAAGNVTVHDVDRLWVLVSRLIKEREAWRGSTSPAPLRKIACVRAMVQGPPCGQFPVWYESAHRGDSFSTGAQGELIITADGQRVAMYPAGMWRKAALEQELEPAK